MAARKSGDGRTATETVNFTVADKAELEALRRELGVDLERDVTLSEAAGKAVIVARKHRAELARLLRLP